MGQVRIDIVKKNLGLIDYSLDKIFRGRSWSRLIIAKTLEIVNKNKKINHFKAEVKKTNLSSIKTFENLFFLKEIKKNKINFNKKY